MPVRQVRARRSEIFQADAEVTERGSECARGGRQHRCAPLVAPPMQAYPFCFNGSNRKLGPRPIPSEKGHHDESQSLPRTALTAVAMAAAYAFVSRAHRSPRKLRRLSRQGGLFHGETWPGSRSRRIATTAPHGGVYTDAKGEYSFPAWSDLTPGSIRSGSICRISRHAAQPVAVAEGKGRESRLHPEGEAAAV